MLIRAPLPGFCYLARSQERRGQLDEVEEIAGRIKHDVAARNELVAALGRLRDYLLTHLQYEEASISPTLRTLNGWPLG